MQFTPETLRRFFSLFQKEISEEEVTLLLEGRGKWNPTPESKKHEKKIEKYLWIFSLVPGLIAVFFCNTTAFRSADKNSDIDLFVVTENNQLWIARVFLTFLTHIFGVRRYGKNIAGRFCLSFFATRTGSFELENLQIEKGNDPYFAVWLATAECVFAEEDFLKTFQGKNSWIFSYKLNFTQTKTSKKSNFFQKCVGNILSKLGVEILLKIFLEKRAVKKMKQLKDSSGTIISQNYLKFHDKDIRKEIQREVFL